jgi:hypothetical protein
VIGYLALTAPWTWKNDDADAIDQSPYRLHGYPHPTVFKTVRNAMKAAGPDGHVLVLDLNALPLVNYHALMPGDQESAMRSWMKRRDWLEQLRPGPDDGQTTPTVPKMFVGEVDVSCLAVDDLFVQFELAERQASLWGERLDKLNKRVKKLSGDG